MDLIKREDAIKAVSEPFDRKYWHYTTRSIRDTVKALKDIPSYEPKQGEWLFKEITDDYHITGLCSVCKERRRIDNFCPNCGAHMKGADNESVDSN